MDEKLTDALDERVALIKQLTDLARRGDYKAVRDGIEIQDQDQLGAIIFMLILQRASDQDGLTEMLAKLN